MYPHVSRIGVIALVQLAVGASLSFAQAIDIWGTVLDKDNRAMANVVVSLKAAGLSDTTGSNGEYHLGGTTGTLAREQKTVRLSGEHIELSIREGSPPVTISIMDCRGRLVKSINSQKLPVGTYSVNPQFLLADASHGVYAIVVRVGSKTFVQKVVNHSRMGLRGSSSGLSGTANTAALTKQTAKASDTISYIKDGQVITYRELVDLVDTLPELFVVQRDIYGNFSRTGADIGLVQAVISGAGIPQNSPKVADLWYNQPNNSYSGFVYFVYSFSVQMYSVHTLVYASDSALTGHSAIVAFPSTAGNVNIPTFDPRNAVPTPLAGNDTMVSVNDTIWLHAAVLDSFSDSTSQWAWSIGGGAFVSCSGPDTFTVAPSTPNPAFRCILRTQDYGHNVVKDTMSVNVVLAPPQPRAGLDTVVSINDTIWLHGGAIDAFGGRITEWAWKIGGSGFLVTSRADTFAIAPNSANSQFRCILRVKDDDGNYATDTMNVDVRLAPPRANAGRDTAVSIKDTIWLHGTATDTLGGRITGWAWKIGSSGFVVTSGRDTFAIAPASANPQLKCIVRARDDDANFGYDTTNVDVLLAPASANAGRDTIVSINDTIRVHGRAVDSFGGRIVEWAWSLNGGAFRVTSTCDTFVKAPGTPGSVKCVLRVKDDDGNYSIDTMEASVLLSAVGSTGFCVTTIGRFGTQNWVSSVPEQPDVFADYAWIGKVVRFNLDTNKVVAADTLFYGVGQYPAISWDGTKVAFFKHGRYLDELGQIQGLSAPCSLAVMNSDGSGLHGLLQLPAAPGLWSAIDWPVGDWVYYVVPQPGAKFADRDNDEVRRVNISSRQDQSVVNYNLSSGPYAPGQAFRFSLSLDGGLVAVQLMGNSVSVINAVRCFPPPVSDEQGCVKFTMVACQASISASGRFSGSYFGGSHTQVYLADYDRTNNTVQTTSQIVSLSDFPTWNPALGLSQSTIDSGGCEMIRWSVNSDKWFTQVFGFYGHAHNIKLGSNSIAANWVDRKAIRATQNAKVVTSGSVGDEVIRNNSCAGDLFLYIPKGYYQDRDGNLVAMPPPVQ